VSHSYCHRASALAEWTTAGSRKCRLKGNSSENREHVEIECSTLLDQHAARSPDWALSRSNPQLVVDSKVFIEVEALAPKAMLDLLHALLRSKCSLLNRRKRTCGEDSDGQEEPTTTSSRRMPAKRPLVETDAQPTNVRSKKVALVM
jgi:hypothetical protein